MTTRWLRARVCRRGVSSAPAAVFFFAMALAGSWPFVFSPKLSGHYLVPSVPFFALGFAALAARSVDAWLALDSRPVSEHDSVRHAVRDAACDSDRDPTRDPDRPSPASSRRTPPATGDRHGWQQRLPRTLAAILIGVSLLLPILHGPMEPRDAPLVRDLTAIDAAMPREAIIGACPHASGQPDWGLHSYVQRWFRVSLDPRGVPAGGWMLVTHGACVPPPACTPAARGVTLSLFRCVTSEKARLE